MASSNGSMSRMENPRDSTLPRAVFAVTPPLITVLQKGVS
jgi:hypothetical protein